MFLASTKSPNEDTTKDEAIEDFDHLIARTCEFVKELEKVGKVEKGSYMPLYEKMKSDATKAIEDGWNA